MFDKAYIFISLCVILFIVSWFKDKKKTIAGVKKGFKMFRNIVLPFINILILISVALYFLPPHLIVQYLGGKTGFMGLAIAALVDPSRSSPVSFLTPLQPPWSGQARPTGLWQRL